jgi:ribosomal protein L37AE/L43A
MSPKEKKRIESMRVSATWEKIPGYLCRTCASVARKHPEADNIWGCATCGYTTYSVYAYFYEVPKN